MNMHTVQTTARLVGMTLLLFMGMAQSQVCRVSMNGTAAADGSSWQQSKDLVSALANPGFCPEIWVKSGTYYPTQTTDRSISFFVAPGVELYGGFNGTESARNHRDFVNNKAVLSANIGHSLINLDNSYHVIFLDGSSGIPIHRNTVIDGFEIRDGNANGQSIVEETGGGIICYVNGSTSECSPTIKNTDFINNQAREGGGFATVVFNGGRSLPKLENCRFIDNSAYMSLLLGGVGGGMAVLGSNGSEVSPYIVNTLFEDNFAEYLGGGLFLSAYSNANNETIISQSTFKNNSAESGGAVANNAHTNGTLRPTFKNVTMVNNVAQNRGGAMLNRSSIPYFYNTTITQNAASNGGGLYNYAATVHTHNSIYWGNGSSLNGDQFYNLDSHITAHDNIIQDGCIGFYEDGFIGKNCLNILTQNPQLGTLQNNQGFTETMVPSTGSPAIDSGNNTSCLNIDQRGFSRPQNGTCDMGAVEVFNTCRVTTNGSVSGDGSNWTNQAMTLQTALNNPLCKNVWIKSGGYVPTQTSDRSISFEVNAGVTVLGGFAGTETNPSERIISANPVILTGNIGDPLLDTDNSYHVVHLDGASGAPILADTVIADLTIQSGYASTSSLDFPNNVGGGIFCNGSGVNGQCSPSLINLKFFNNIALSGGALFNHADQNGLSNPQIIDVLFEQNKAGRGGAIYNNGSQDGESSPFIVNGNFYQNQGVGSNSSGGAIFNNAFGGYSRPNIYLSEFYQNDADYGGAIYSAAQNFGISTPLISETTLTSNHAQFDGGALWSAGWNDGQSKPTIRNSSFVTNVAQRGGALYLNDLAGHGTADVENTTFAGNSATDGGAIYNDGENGQAHPGISNSTFTNNSATAQGGAIHNNGENGDSSPSILNVTFSGNQANYGAAMFSTGGLNGASSPTMRHIIMWGNTATTEGHTIYHSQAESTIDDSIIEYGCPNVGFGNTNCSNIIDQNPLLGTLADNGGFSRTMLPDTNSPAIDAGDNVYCPGEDQRGESRPKGAACDIGAVEVDTQGPSDIIFKDGFD